MAKDRAVFSRGAPFTILRDFVLFLIESRVYGVLIYDKEISHNREKEDIYWFEEVQRATNGIID